ncbi:MAG: Protein GrpE [Chlamydiia bacterium]|nr:Protein GrpE [Chlamydiia bacterium]
MSQDETEQTNNDEEIKPSEKAEEESKTTTIGEMMSEHNEKLQKELTDYKDKYQRTLAEMENMRKRLINEKQDMINFAVENIIADFIQPLDNFENALGFTDQMSDDTKAWAQGFQMILSQFKDILNDNGITTFHSMGKQFDHHKHDAVETEERDDVEPGTITKELTKGYMRHDRVLRHARVVVAKSSKDSSTDEEDKQVNHEDEGETK